MRGFTTFEVIAPYPSAIYEVGEQFQVMSSSYVAYITEMNDDTEDYDVREYPHLFKEIKDN